MGRRLVFKCVNSVRQAVLAEDSEMQDRKKGDSMSSHSVPGGVLKPRDEALVMHAATYMTCLMRRWFLWMSGRGGVSFLNTKILSVRNWTSSEVDVSVLEGLESVVFNASCG